LNLPPPLAAALEPVFAELPLEAAMPELVVSGPASASVFRRVEEAILDPALRSRPALVAGLWLFVDELDRSHAISQDMHDATGSFWHGIMHRREGDFSNSHYWFRKAGKHPAMAAIAGYDSHAFIDEVAAAHPAATPELVARQRLEWASLFEWCAAQ